MALGVSEVFELQGLKVSQREAVFPVHRGTELLAQELARIVRPGMRVLDIGTGTGALALVAANGGAEVVATDISLEACQLAYENATKNNLERNIKFCVGNLAEAIVLPDIEKDGFDIVVFNLPSSPFPDNLQGDTNVDGGPNGRKYIDQFLKVLPSLLKTGGTAITIQSNLSDVSKTFQELEAKNFSYVYTEHPTQAGTHTLSLVNYIKENLPLHCQLQFDDVTGKYYYYLFVITAVKGMADALLEESLH